MQLKLFIERLGKSYTLKPGRNVVVGSSSDCDIAVPSKVQEKLLRFNFDSTTQAWTVEALSDSGMLVNDQPSSHEVLREITRIKTKGGTLIATPEGAQQPVLKDTLVYNGSAHAAMPQAIKEEAAQRFQSAQAGLSNFVEKATNDYVNRQRTAARRPSSSLKEISWADFAKARSGRPNRDWQTWYHLITGIRTAIWIKPYSAEAFDGFIIPNFRGSIDNVVNAIEANVSNLGGYDDTECAPVRLTDGHISDSRYSSLSEIEFRPIKRSLSNEPDHRRFYVTTYHRVRNYLLCEKYGKDLFVSWITRFEPEEPEGNGLTALLFPALIGFCFLAIGEIWAWLSPLPFIMWIEIFIITPAIMAKYDIIPRRSNAYTIMIFLIVPTLLLFFYIIMMMMQIGLS
jgi:hypothetical protein